jgi:4-hydroxy-tetrahydrodipicolinate synthase
MVFTFVVTAQMTLWGVVRPPGVDLTPAQCDALAAALREIGFSMPGIEVTV